MKRFNHGFFKMRDSDSGDYVSYQDYLDRKREYELDYKTVKNHMAGRISSLEDEIKLLKENKEHLLAVVHNNDYTNLTGVERDKLALKLYDEDYDQVSNAVIRIYTGYDANSQIDICKNAINSQ